MTVQLHDLLTEALESIKSGGLIRRYSLVWAGRSEAPRIIVWKSADVADEALRRTMMRSLAGLAAESQIVIEKD
ncbi:hypothetical protein ABIF38_002550 [Bradyrhizobium japonicum]|jgi:hypothetical protein|uniref:Uncharacterized protein n=1 Tax=Bradyrhizobium elkanii TaxID=29448 RepID=A0ABV4FC99_BRAEL|nr:hypothetical protein [Bradyrhizobium elkanii]MBP2431789.1 hypothetical protein [Bradyrhizobium elkanii]MCP1735137.1 hypothetical protein [Bradyrhizobium elkanii]MCP1752682.1 hypothetical protein [Bradyrhizobium elkanii]MCP1978455.1 hypothetical protein [Bradyrhizobium elkanii]MCS3570478.1 hypothetical protein [Bradyrhizobium elkanii]